MKSVETKILDRVHDLGRGSVFTTGTFLDLGSRAAVDKVLSRLAQKGTLRRLARGLYDYPKSRPIMGVLAPDPNAVVRALSRKYGIRIQPTGAYAANVLGLSGQVPAKIAFLTDGPSRVVRVGNQDIYLRHTTLKNMATAGRMSGLVIQALLHLGPDYVDDKVIAILQRKLSAQDKKKLLADIAYAPTWVGTHLRRIAMERHQIPRNRKRFESRGR
jgi:Family of unknown function (DUF6088)